MVETVTELTNFTTNMNMTDNNSTFNGTFYGNLNTTITDVYTNQNNVPVENEGRPTWRRILDVIQVILLSWGIITNMTSAICFRRQPAGFSRQILLLFEHQSWIDFTSCVTGFFTVVLPTYWVVGWYRFDLLICYLWHGQIFYWTIAANSFYGLVLIALDRYLAVVKPIYYKTITVKKIYIVIAMIYITSFIMCVPLAFLVKMEGGKCVAGLLVEGNVGVVIVKVHAVVLTIYEYVIPCMWFFGLYGKIIHTLKKKKEGAIEGSSTMEKASSQIIKAAAAVTGLFMFTIGKIFGYLIINTASCMSLQAPCPHRK